MPSSARLLSCLMFLVFKCYATDVFLNHAYDQPKDQTIKASVVTEKGSVYTLTIPAKNSAEKPALRLNWKKGQAASPSEVEVFFPRDTQLSNPVAINTGGDREVFVLLGFRADTGYSLYRVEITGSNYSLVPFKISTPDTLASHCRKLHHLSVSVGLREKVTFASDCIVGEYDFFGAGRLSWIKHHFHRVYAAIPPAINSKGEAHFVVRAEQEAKTLVIRSSGFKSFDVSNFAGPPASLDDHIEQYGVSGVVAMADDSLLLSGRSGYLRIDPSGTQTQISHAQNWGSRQYGEYGGRLLFAGVV